MWHQTVLLTGPYLLSKPHLHVKKAAKILYENGVSVMDCICLSVVLIGFTDMPLN